MTATVPHFRPDFETDAILSGEPVSAWDWSALAGLANFAQGHGAMLIPWSAIGYRVASGASQTFHFYVAPKLPAVERVWRVTVRSGTAGATATITAGGASAVTVVPGTPRDAATTYTIREPLSAKTSTAAGTTLVVAASGGTMRVVACAMYEQTRGGLDLDTTDYGADLGTVVVRTPILDAPSRSLSGVCDAYKNADARRAGLFHWSTPVAVPITITGGSTTTLFTLSPPTLGPVVLTGATTVTVTVAAYAKVDSGTATVTFESDGASDTEALSITSTSFAWVTGTLTIDCEDLAVADGRRSTRWEGLTITGADATATTLSIAAISVVRAGSGPL